MAIIVCPECGGKISDTATQCIHCGAKVKNCPECGTVYTEAVRICSECGYTFEEKKAANETSQTDHKSSKDVVDEWNREKPYVKYIFSSIAEHIMDLIPLVFSMVALVQLLQWDDVLSFSETLSNIKTFIVLSTIFRVIYCIYDIFAKHGKEKMLCSWCLSNKTNLKDSIRTTLQMDFDSMRSVEGVKREVFPCVLCLRATAFFNDTSANANINKIIFANIILAITRAIFLAVFLITNAEIYMVARLFETESSGGWKISMVEDWWLPIMAVATFVAGYLLDKLSVRIEKKACLDYIQKNLPECRDVYSEIAVMSSGFRGVDLK